MATEIRPLRKDAERNRLRILQAAREVFAEQGLGATLDDVARHAGVGVGTVYRRFPDKDALIDAVLEERIGELVALAEQGAAAPDAWEGLTFFLREGLSLQARDRGLKEIACSTGRGHERIARMRERIGPVVEGLLRRAQADGAVRADLEVTDVPMLQFMVGHIVDYARDVDPELWRRYHAILIDGLRPARAEPAPLPRPALDAGQLDRAMSAWRPPAR